MGDTSDPESNQPPFSSPRGPLILANNWVAGGLFAYNVLAMVAVLVLIASIWPGESTCNDDKHNDALFVQQDGGVQDADGTRPIEAHAATTNAPDAGAPPPIEAQSRTKHGGLNPSEGPQEKRCDNRRLLYLVFLFGALGGLMHGLASMSAHLGLARLTSNWWLYYIARPLVGGGLALCIHVVLRGGLGGLALDEGPKGEFAAMGWAALSGLFSAPAMKKLRDIFEAILRPSPDTGQIPPPKGKGPTIEPKSDVQPVTKPVAPKPP